MDIYGTKFDVLVVRPDRVEKLLAGEDFSGFSIKWRSSRYSVGPSATDLPPRFTLCDGMSISKSE